MMLMAVTSFGAAFGQIVGGGDQRAAGGEHRVEQEALTAVKGPRAACSHR
jgi:hypothetical protein